MPVTISAVWPAGFVHPHLVSGGAVNPRAASLTAWPMQIASAEDVDLARGFRRSLIVPSPILEPPAHPC
ncbi:MAG TPA: hypothetical protein VHK65_13335 [Candidatus Dormibacteraeota bacterium]|nr:hypothetical protein [Candidatus Dormibacteraeota bacterium]